MAAFSRLHLTTGPVQKLQVFCQRHEHAALVRRSTRRTFLTNLFALRLKFHRSQPARTFTMFDACVFGISRRDFISGFQIGNAFLSTRKVACFRSCRDSCSHGPRIHIHRTRRDRQLRQNCCFESSFRKSPGTLFFSIRDLEPRPSAVCRLRFLTGAAPRICFWTGSYSAPA